MSGQNSIDRLVEDIRQDVAASYGTETAHGSTRHTGAYLRGLDDGIRLAVRALLRRALDADSTQERASA